MTRHAIVATTTAGKPSRRKSNLHGAIGPPSPTLAMTHANEEAKAVASGAAVLWLASFVCLTQ